MVVKDWVERCCGDRRSFVLLMMVIYLIEDGGDEFNVQNDLKMNFENVCLARIAH
jgi:hypothetical protein